MSGGLDDQRLKRADFDPTPSVRASVTLSRDEQRALVHRRAATRPLSIKNVVLLQGTATLIERAQRGVVVAFPGLYGGPVVTAATQLRGWSRQQNRAAAGDFNGAR